MKIEILLTKDFFKDINKSRYIYSDCASFLSAFRGIKLPWLFSQELK